jgi:mannose-1-phosphate guanylyltransferase/mannose-1-phosphate guanylyltransferase/mannose-6-phosphate isomerase
MNIIDDERPWGSFRQFTSNEISTVKILRVKAGQKLSLQYHKKREEFWVVLSGNPSITIGEETKIANPQDEFFITQESVHRIAAPTNDVEILEIAFGEFDEQDIVRIEDAYGRVA